MKNLIDFEKEMTLVVLEERLEMVARAECCAEGGQNDEYTKSPSTFSRVTTTSY